MKTTRYFSGDIELKSAYPVENEVVAKAFPGIKAKWYDSFSRMVGRVDGKWSTSEFLPVTRVILHNPAGKMHKCDARCRTAKGHQCECECGGKNHGCDR